MMESLVLLVQLSLGLVFLGAFAAKLRAPGAFLRGVADYEVLPKPAALAVGALLIPVEGLLAAAHLSGWLLTPAVVTGSLLLVNFAVAVDVNLRRQRDLSCHCFGSGGERISSRTLARLYLMIGGELIVLAGMGLPVSLHRPVFLDGLPQGLPAGPGLASLIHLALLCCLLLIGAGWLLRARDVWSLFQEEQCHLCAALSKEEKSKRRSR